MSTQLRNLIAFHQFSMKQLQATTGNKKLTNIMGWYFWNQIYVKFCFFSKENQRAFELVDFLQLYGLK